MTQSGRARVHLKMPPVGLLLQLFAIILLPLTVLLVAITFGSISIHQRAMRSLVGARDERAARMAAGAISAQVDIRVKELTSVEQILTINPPNPEASSLNAIGYLIPDLDKGAALFSQQGELVSTSGNQQFWEQWSGDASWQKVFTRAVMSARKPITAENPRDGGPYGLIAAAVSDRYLVVGGFSIKTLTETTLRDALPGGGQLSILLVGTDNQILYQVGDLPDQSAEHPGVEQALSGQSGTVYVKVSGDEHVTAYSPVAATGWALVTEESWEAVATPALRASQIAPLVLVPAVLIMLLALWMGARQVVKPLRQLESKAATLAGGDFTAIHEPVGGIAEIQHLQKELVSMADKLDDAQRSLHSYIGAITQAQEDERRRLARELHDDTLQALIALKQRVQLAQLELQRATALGQTEPAELGEIATLTGQTIENLHRLTRALRPVYLEDLGLVPALEMLARETRQAMGIQVNFTRMGNEKRLEPPTELALYRIAQEALSNISRHARARHASVLINYSVSEVILQVTDDGAGFNLPKYPAEYAAQGHYGLLGMHERAELIGAILTIHSAAGKGTRVTATLPLSSTKSI